MTLVDLASLEEVEDNLMKRRAQTRERSLPFLSGPVGPGSPWPAGINQTDRYPLTFVAATITESLAMARLIPEPAMRTTLGEADIAILNTSVRARSVITPGGLYVLDLGGETRLRYVRFGAAHQYLVTDVAMNQPLTWQPLRVSGAALVNQVRAQVIWLGKEKNAALPMDQRGIFLAAISS